MKDIKFKVNILDIFNFERFLPRDAMHKRGICRHAVSVLRLSVSPSPSFVHYVKTNKDIFQIFSQSGSHTILVFLYQTSWQYSDGPPPLTGESNAGGVGKNPDSRPVCGMIAQCDQLGVINTVPPDRGKL